MNRLSVKNTSDDKLRLICVLIDVLAILATGEKNRNIQSNRFEKAKRIVVASWSESKLLDRLIQTKLLLILTSPI